MVDRKRPDGPRRCRRCRLTPRDLGHRRTSRGSGRTRGDVRSGVPRRVHRRSCDRRDSVFGRALEALADEAHVLGVELRALATTLCIAVLVEDRATIAQIGDGVAVVERASGKIESVAVAERFEYANEVVFLTAPSALAHLKIFTATDDPVRNVALSTDGLRYKVLDDLQASQPFEQFFHDSWNYARSEPATSAAIEAFLREVDDQTGDDKTLVLAVSSHAGAPGDAWRLTDRPAAPRPPEISGTAAADAGDHAP